MRIAFIYGPVMLGTRFIDFNNLYTSPRGLTGSELSCIRYAEEMANLGHNVALYFPGKKPYQSIGSLDNLKVKEISHLVDDVYEGYDVYYVWCDPDVLRVVPKNSLRIVNQQVNDFVYCTKTFDKYVDFYTSPSFNHKNNLSKQTPSPDKWCVIYNGCDSAKYEINKVPGRIIYASSPDRGLHHLLEMWPDIKKKVPEAHLKIFYHMDDFLALLNLDGIHPSQGRAKLVKDNLKQEGIEVVGSVSKERIFKEMAEASVLAYPCDPYTYTEGFSVTIMEACVYGAIPVITDADALKELYQGCPMVKRERIKEDYINLLVDVLTSDNIDLREKIMEIPQKYFWKDLAKNLENFLLERLNENPFGNSTVAVSH